jgi:chromosome segregation ATPase
MNDPAPTLMPIQRYDLEFFSRGHNGGGRMEKRDDGEWLRWDDHATALSHSAAELAALHAEMDALELEHSRLELERVAEAHLADEAEKELAEVRRERDDLLEQIKGSNETCNQYLAVNNRVRAERNTLAKEIAALRSDYTTIRDERARFHAERDRLRAALAELVRLKGIKESIEAAQSGLFTVEIAEDYRKWLIDYNGSKDAAWDAARKALDGT